MSGLRRHVASTRQTDVVDWMRKHNAELSAMRQRRWQLEKGVVTYLKQGFEFVQEMRSSRKERKEMTDEQRVAKQSAGRNSPVVQYERSQELLRKLKWKRVTWEPEANYDDFSQRIVDDDAAFTKTPAFSFLTVRLVRDPSVAAIQPTGQLSVSTNMRDLRTGSLTSWFLEQRDAELILPWTKPSAARPSPITVNWESGEVKILETTSPRELATFLETTAPRVQAIQQRIDQEHTRMTEDLEVARRRLGAFAIKFNKNDTSFWDDDDRATDPKYVTPGHMRMFLDAAMSRSVLLRWYWRGQHIRVVHPSEQYAFDQESNEIRIPANFADYSFLPVHNRALAVGKKLDVLRKLSMVWFVLAVMVVGDLEIL